MQHLSLELDDFIDDLDMKGTLYFQHDYNARNDPKIIKLMRVHGLAGVGAYWCIVELLYQNDGILPLEEIESISFVLHTEYKCISSVIQDFELFKFDDKHFWSDSVTRRLDKRKKLSETRKNAIKTRWNDTNEIQLNQQEDTNVLHKKYKIVDLIYKDKNNNIYSSNEESENKSSPTVDFAKIVDMYHELCPSFPKLFKLSAARQQKIRIRFVEEMKNDWSILEEVFKKMEKSKFLRGDNPRGWKATFDWLFTNDKNWCKVYEGNFDNRTLPPKGKSTAKPNEEWE